MAEFGRRREQPERRLSRIAVAAPQSGSSPVAARPVSRVAAPTRPTVHQDEGLRAYMLGVYNLMMLGVAFSGAIVMFLVARPDILKLLIANPAFPIVIFVGTLGLSFFSGAIIQSRSPILGHVFFWAYAALWGMGLAPLIAFMTHAGHVDIVARAFFIAASMFGAASLYGYTTGKDLSGWGCILAMLCWGLLLATVLNIFVFRTPMFGLILCYVTVVVFTAVTAWETQMIKDLYDPADDQDGYSSKSIFGAFQLYGSFMMIFSRLLRILWSIYEEVG